MGLVATNSLRSRIKIRLERYPNLLASIRYARNAARRAGRGRDIELINKLPLFAPQSQGSYKTLAKLTLLSANQTFPLLTKLLKMAKRDRLIVVNAEKFADDVDALQSAKQLANLFDTYGSDKSSIHNYHYIYGAILKQKKAIQAILEIGLGTNNQDIVSHMGHEGKPGASVRAFRDFLPNAEIFGADIDGRILFQEDRIKTFFVDQTSLESLDALGQSIQGDLDLIIDDGLHSPNANLSVLIFAIGKLKPGGWLVIEDIRNSASPVWQVVAEILPKEYKPYLITTKSTLVFAVEKTKKCK